MKKNLAFIMLISMGILSGCSLLNKSTKATGVEVTGVEIPIEEDVVPDDTEEVAPQDNSSTTDTSKSYRKISGEWTIVAVGNKKIDAPEMPFITFSVKDKRIYGNNGCNVINGDFTVGNDHTISFTNILTSMMACPDAKYEEAINKAINEARTYSYSTIDGKIHLNLFNSHGNIVLKLRKHNLSALNGAWTVKEINAEAVGENSVKLTIDIDQLKLHGNSGCNIINGTILLDPKKKNAIQFQDIISTRKMCPDIEIETKLLVVLESVEYYTTTAGSQEVSLLDKKKKTIAVLQRLNLD